jgi:heavy metal sensor kinase
MKAASLRFRITLSYVSLLAAALVVFGASVYLGLASYLRTSLKHSLVEASTNIAQRFVSEFNQKGKGWVAGEVSEAYAPEISGRFIRITRLLPSGGSVVIYQSGNTTDPYIDTANILRPDLLDNAPSVRTERTSRSSSWMIYTLPYTTPDQSHFLIEVGTMQRPTERVLRGLFLALVILTPLTLLAAATCGYFLMSQPLRPIAELTRHAENIGIHGTGERLPIIASGDELERLSLSLNRMIGRLEDALAHIRRFSADVSHELHTPLTILRGELEPIVQQLGPDSALNDTIGSALEEIDRMSRIVDSLLAISRLDSGGAGIESTQVDLSELVASTTDQMRLLADERQITITCSSSGPVQVMGDPVRLKQIVVNLLDNAIKYTQTGGQIKTFASVDSGFGILEVTDNGMGIPEESQPHVFERFYRADKARSRGSGGAGLGLSIVKAICSAHAGTVSLTSREGTGTTLRVALPLNSRLPPKGTEAIRSRPTLAERRTPTHDEGPPARETPGVTAKL